MRESYILPVYNPFIVGYMHHACVFSLINIEDYSNSLWFSNNYIQLSCPKTIGWNRNDQLDFSHETFNSAFEDSLLTVQKIHKNNIRNYVGGVVKFLTDNISENNYIELMVNDFYIEGTSSFKQINFSHNIFIYGFNNTSKTFNVRYMKNDLFADTTITYSNMEVAFNNTSDTDNWSNYSKVYSKIENSSEFDLTRFIDFTTEYINSNNHYRNSKLAYGFEVYNYVIEYLNNLQSNLTSNDIRIVHLLWEHKKSMAYKIQFLSKNKLLNIDASLIGNLLSIEEQAFKIRNMQLKYMITGDKNTITQMINDLNDIKELESTVYVELLNGLI